MEKGTFTDPRDGKTYKTVKIGKQTWMAEIFGGVKIKSPNDYIVVPHIGSRNVALTLTRCRMAFTGCFEGTWEQLLNASKRTHRGKPEFIRQYKDAVEAARRFFEGA